jgi:hypothetical protein
VFLLLVVAVGFKPDDLYKARRKTNRIEKEVKKEDKNKLQMGRKPI